jgi:hypothetical protein
MVWTSFSAYLGDSLKGVFTNELFMGILLALIITDLRGSKYFKWEDYIQRDYLGIPKGFWKFISIILVYALIIPVALVIMALVIFVLWGIHVLTGA